MRGVRPTAAREAYSLYVERAAEGANDADGPFSAACESPESEKVGTTCTPEAFSCTKEDAHGPTVVR